MTKNHNVRLQIERLGLEKFLAGALNGFNILDVGCGTEASLVKHFLQKGYCAEGIDDTGAKSYPGVMNQTVTAPWPKKGCIPRERNTYHIMTAHQNSLLNQCASALRDTDFLRSYVFQGENFEKAILEYDLEAEALISEMLRVLRQDGIMIMYPAADRIERVFGKLLGEQWKVVHKPVQGVPEDEGILFVEPFPGYFIRDDCTFVAKHRTAIYNPRQVNPELKAMLID